MQVFFFYSMLALDICSNRKGKIHLQGRFGIVYLAKHIKLFGLLLFVKPIELIYMEYHLHRQNIRYLA